MQPLIVSYSGIRGVVGESLDEAVAFRYGRGFGRMVAARFAAPTVLLGRDTRPSGVELARGAARGLAPFARLIDLGVVATPTLQHALGALGADAALCVTASHNPRQWNGLKLFLGPDNTVLDGTDIRELRLLADLEADPPPAGVAPPVDDCHTDAVRLHLDRVAAQVDGDAIRARGFRVAVDSAGGAGAEATELLLARLGCEVVVVRSARESEPIPEHLDELRAAVVGAGCALGVAQDLDADRLALVTEAGAAPGEEQTLVLAVAHLLRRFPDGPRVVVKNVATTCAIDELAARHGAALVETPVGEVNLSRALLDATRRGDVAFGGEGNGGVIFPPVSLGRDSLLGIALVLDSLAADPAPLSARLAGLPRWHMAKRKVPLGASVDELAGRVTAAYPDAVVSRLDGLRARFADGSWFAIRPSNTEPILRLVVESRAPAWVDATARAVEELILTPADRLS